MTMTDDKMAEIKKLCDAATPGPWFMRTNRHADTSGKPWGWLDALPSGGPQRAIPGVRVDWTRGDESEANARFIAAARTAVPDLLALVETLRRERDEALASEARLIEAMIMELASERPSEKIMREALQQCGCTPAAAGIAGAAWRKLAALAASERGS